MSQNSLFGGYFLIFCPKLPLAGKRKMRRGQGNEGLAQRSRNSMAESKAGAAQGRRVKRNRRQQKAEEATLSFCRWTKQDMCCNGECAEKYAASHVQLCRLAVLHAQNKHIFLSHRMKVISHVVMARSLGESPIWSDDTVSEAPEDTGPNDEPASHLRRRFFIDSFTSLEQYASFCL